MTSLPKDRNIEMSPVKKAQKATSIVPAEKKDARAGSKEALIANLQVNDSWIDDFKCSQMVKSIRETKEQGKKDREEAVSKLSRQ